MHFIRVDGEIEVLAANVEQAINSFLTYSHGSFLYDSQCERIIRENGISRPANQVGY